MKRIQQSGTTSKRGSRLSNQAAGAFTLIEVLLAITITGFLLAAASTMLVSVTNIWSSRLDRNSFEDHVDGVAEFIQSSFSNAGVEISLSTSNSDANKDENANPEGSNNNGNTPEVSIDLNQGTTGGNARGGTSDQSSTSGLISLPEDPISWAEPPGFANYRDPLLNFKLHDQPPLFVNMDNAPALGIDAFLYFDKDDGLALLWYSVLQEETEDENDLRRTAVSPYVTSIRYIYWDESFEQWEEEEEPMEGENDQYLLPRFLKLIFENDGITKERTISIPVPSRSALLF